MDIGPSFLRQSGICKPLGRGGVASFNPCKKYGGIASLCQLWSVGGDIEATIEVLTSQS